MPAKIINSEEIILAVKTLYATNKGMGARKIAVALNITRDRVINILKSLDIYDSDKRPEKTADKYVERVCKICEVLKPIDQFRKRYNKEYDRTSYEPYCIPCEKERNKELSSKNYYENWYERKKYREDNAEKIAVYDKAYRKQNKNILKVKSLKRAKEKRKTDPFVRLRQYVSNAINSALKKIGSKKTGSFTKYLPYTIQQLKIHIESLFEPWMTWKNHGRYDPKTWDDNNQDTWVWQLDHIIPQDNLRYISMEDVNFKTCWALSNLRPLSAKQNNQDGVRKTRYILENTA